MADKIQADATPGANLYALVWNSAGDVWNPAASPDPAFVSYATADRGDYDLPMTEQGTASGHYTADFPVLNALGLYHVVAHVRAGGSPAEGDAVARSYDVEWNVTEERLGVSVPLSNTAAVAGTISDKIGDTSSGTVIDQIVAVANDSAEAMMNNLDPANFTDPNTFGGLFQGVGGVRMPVSVADIDGSATAASKLAAHTAAVSIVTIGNGSSTTSIVLNTVDGAAPPSQSDTFNGRVLVITSGALNRQATTISDYDGSTGTLTVAALTGSPINGVTGVIV